jgi:hypothetical protein
MLAGTTRERKGDVVIFGYQSVPKEMADGRAESFDP